MSSRYWLLGLAIGGWLVGPILDDGACAKSGNTPYSYNETTTIREQKTQSGELGIDQSSMLSVKAIHTFQPAWLSKDEEVLTNNYWPYCERPQNYEEANLCEQRKSADASIESAYWAKIQSWTNIIGVVFVVATLIASIFATRAAVRAAKAAEVAANSARDTVITMREIDQRQSDSFLLSLAISKQAADASDLSAKALIGVELANLHILSVVAMGNLDDPNKWIAHFIPEIFIRNYGRTPAFITGIVTNNLVAPMMAEHPTYVEYTDLPSRLVVPGGGEYRHTDPVLAVRGRLSEQDKTLYLSGKGDLFVYGVIRFRDFLGMYWEKGFIFSTRIGMTQFIDAGRIYPAYDYHKIQAKPDHNASSSASWPP